MAEYCISRIYPSDKKAFSKIDSLLRQEGISRDANLDYTCAIYDDDMHIIATRSCFKNTLRCMAVDHRHQGEGLLNQIVSHLIDYQYSRGIYHIFIYTKLSTEKFFRDLGFYEIARVDGKLVFMENRATGFSDYLDSLKGFWMEGNCSAIVMNANPFTLGHRYLIEQAAAASDHVHLFIVSEDASLFPFEIRKRLVMEGVSDIKNVICHDSGPYIISNATFPSYFLRDSRDVIESHARLDIEIFARIASACNISSRFVGEEPFSEVTGIYNRIMQEQLPAHGIACHIVPRKPMEGSDQPISASTVREAIRTGDVQLLKRLLPESTLSFLQSKEAAPLIQRIKAAASVVHY